VQDISELPLLQLALPSRLILGRATTQLLTNSDAFVGYFRPTENQLPSSGLDQEAAIRPANE